MSFKRADFGEDFHWGVSTSSFQAEGTFPQDGRGWSIWDEFCRKKGNIKDGSDAKTTAAFFKHYHTDLKLIKWMNLENFRFSISWPRLMPNSSRLVNQKGIDFYDRLIDQCLEMEIQPWVTLYHWDLPLWLERQGGWTNRNLLGHFERYIDLCMKHYSDRVERWMVLNEPTAFTALGYYLGIHAPGKKGRKNFLPALHHAALAQAEGSRQLKSYNSELKIGTTFSFSHVEASSNKSRHRAASRRVDALLNKLFIEPLLGMGYPIGDLPFLNELEPYVKADDMEKLAEDLDFIGVQNYSREIVAHSCFTPIVKAKLVSAAKRDQPTTAMNWEVYPDSIYKVLKRLSRYENIPSLVVTENGAAFEDEIKKDGSIDDQDRKSFLQEYLKSTKKAIQEGVKLDGFFVWSLTDNFEWAEGFRPRFGLIYVDYDSLQRIPKKSAQWLKDFLISDQN